MLITTVGAYEMNSSQSSASTLHAHNNTSGLYAFLDTISGNAWIPAVPSSRFQTTNDASHRKEMPAHDAPLPAAVFNNNLKPGVTPVPSSSSPDKFGFETQSIFIPEIASHSLPECMNCCTCEEEIRNLRPFPIYNYNIAD